MRLPTEGYWVPREDCLSPRERRGRFLQPPPLPELIDPYRKRSLKRCCSGRTQIAYAVGKDLHLA